MLRALSSLSRALEWLVSLPIRAGRFLFATLIFNPRLGKLRLVVAPFALYLLFALTLTYVYAPLRGAIGQVWMERVLTYADERSLGTAVTDAGGRFIGILDPVLDSEDDLNLSGRPIETPDYIAYPDHKALHLDESPPDYWRCLAWLEDRHLGGWINPFGIDLFGVLKIPVSTVRRSIESGGLSLGVGGSTLSMQLARIFFKSPPSRNESAAEKLSRKFKEWWLAPVIHWRLARGGDKARVRVWAANHFPHAQRTGGQELYGVETTSRILFGKPAGEMSVAEQYVLAAAVNQPIILLGGSERMDALQKSSWARIAGKRARVCAKDLQNDASDRDQVEAELTRMISKPPAPVIDPVIAQAVDDVAPDSAGFARANPILRANILIPSARYGAREELREAYGYGWRRAVRGVTLTLDAPQNLRFGERVDDALARAQARFGSRLAPAFTLDPAGKDAPGGPLRIPDIVVAAADAEGRLVRYFESNFTAAYYGAAGARDRTDGRYVPGRESRAIASIGKMAAAVAIANDGGRRDGKWVDFRAPAQGLDECLVGKERRLRNAELSFACSLNAPLEWRAARVPLSELSRLTRGFGLRPLDKLTSGPNLAKSLVVGQVAASPRTVHRMSATVLSALTQGADASVRLPSMLEDARVIDGEQGVAPMGLLAPSEFVKPESHEALRAYLSAPLCHARGTLRRLSDWCAGSRESVALHFAKTGTRGNGSSDPSAPDTVDLWVSGGIEFKSGAAFSYVLMMGTGNPSDPFARDLYAGQALEPLVRVLLDDLEVLSRQDARVGLDAGRVAE